MMIRGRGRHCQLFNPNICIEMLWYIQYNTKLICLIIVSSSFLQIVYVDMGNQNTDSVTLAFTFTITTTTRNWEIKVSQIECWNAGR